MPSSCPLLLSLVVKSDGSRANQVTGSLEIGSQYHFAMETQSCLVWPIENGQFEVRSPSQFQSWVQMGVAKALDIPLNKVNTEVMYNKSYKK